MAEQQVIVKKVPGPWQDFLAGNFAGMAQVLVGQPLDTVKVRLQLDSGVGRFNGAIDCVVKTVRNEGFFALYKGMLSPLIGIGAVNSLLFAANSRFKALQQDYPNQVLSLSQIAIAGAGAGFVNTILSSPVELLKVRMQAQFGRAGTSTGGMTNYRGPFDVAGQLMRDHGVRRGLFQGFWITALREIPGYAGFYTGFEAVKRAIVPDGKDPSTLQLMTAGAAGGIGYWTCCYPLDVVKSVVQNQAVPPKGSYILHTFRTIYQREGARAFFAGFTTSISLPLARPSRPTS
ncbi:mitochondrial carrier domain-containing protein [Jimgerdemannia flammicorona]|uniref:Mitochondrial carrier domain-containing protein n=1 Tax=Jimgerdemannia flammicorona TaxID=994334 RepID=A0A433CW51_9FUNG|nr:mitochondrial carrier domain-containing protein [Jimgerdemannia flammicorona]